MKKYVVLLRKNVIVKVVQEAGTIAVATAWASREHDDAEVLDVVPLEDYREE